MKLSFEDEDSFKEVVETLRFNKLPSDPDALALEQLESSGSMPQEINEDINSTSDPSSLRRVGSTSSNEIEVVPR